jgi:hypothetical protein
LHLSRLVALYPIVVFSHTWVSTPELEMMRTGS